MVGANGATLPNGLATRIGSIFDVMQSIGVRAGNGSGALIVGNYLWVFFAGLIAVLLPNVAQIFHAHDPVLYEKPGSFAKALSRYLISWRPTPKWAFTTATMLVLGVLTLTQISEFLYFQF
jgi:hypothetical protein